MASVGSVDHAAFMRRAIELSKEGMRKGEGGPFGAVVVKDGQIVGEGWNLVLKSNDPTAHAEVSAIRDACKKMGSFSLQGCVVYTSCEPCPMCLAAMYWANVESFYFGNSQFDADTIGFRDSIFYSELEKAPGDRKVKAIQILKDEAISAFQEWDAKANKSQY